MAAARCRRFAFALAESAVLCGKRMDERDVTGRWVDGQRGGVWEMEDREKRIAHHPLFCVKAALKPVCKRKQESERKSAIVERPENNKVEGSQLTGHASGRMILVRAVVGHSMLGSDRALEYITHCLSISFDDAGEGVSCWKSVAWSWEVER